MEQRLSTAILQAGMARGLIAANDIDGFRNVIDFSADSAYSAGGVPIGQERAAAFTDFIVGGPGHFVAPADEDESFADAVRRKLLLEIARFTPR